MIKTISCVNPYDESINIDFVNWNNILICCKYNECKLCCIDRDINAFKNILGFLLSQYRGEKKPVCFRPDKIDVKHCKSDKRGKTCGLPLYLIF
jgi:hypothetical protein